MTRFAILLLTIAALLPMQSTRAEDNVSATPTWVVGKPAHKKHIDAQAAASPQVVAPPAPVDYRVGVGDRLKISVYNTEKLSGEFAVSGDGRIAYPMLGRLSVAGKTLPQITAIITALLSNGFLLNPSLTVEVATFRPVYILGEVQKPGQYPFTENLTLYSLVAQAGGFTYRGNRKTLMIRHEGDVAERKLRTDGVVSIQPGDTIRILQRYF